MSVPKQRRTSSSKKRRASHFAIKSINLSECAKCKKPVLSHRVCAECGYYKGREAVDYSKEDARKIKSAQTQQADDSVKQKEEKKALKA